MRRRQEQNPTARHILTAAHDGNQTETVAIQCQNTFATSHAGLAINCKLGCATQLLPTHIDGTTHISLLVSTPAVEVQK
jgi:hypothetical protein